MRGKPKLVKLRDRNGEHLPNWYIQYYEGRSKRITTGYGIGTQDHEANLALAQFVLDREKPAAREPDQLTVVQVLRDYYNEHAQYIATSGNALRHEERLKEHFGVYFVSNITNGRINDYVRKCQARGESNGTIRRDLSHLKAALNHEIREQRLIYAPKFKMPPPPSPRQRFLSTKEIRALLKGCGSEHVRHFTQIMLATGQRPAQVENLKWFQVDFKERLIHFKAGHANKKARSVPMNQEIYDLLKMLDKRKQTEYVLEYEGEHAGCVRKAFTRACQRAGIEGVSRYTLRHTFGTQKYIEGYHAKDIGDIMGHTTAETTAEHYLHTHMDRLRALVEGKKSAHFKRNNKNRKVAKARK